jgi:transposase
MTQERVFVGIDVSKARLDVHLYPAGVAFSVANDRAGLRALTKQLGKRDMAVAVEASGGYEKPVARHLMRVGFTVYVLDPAQVRAFGRGLKRHAKTDPIDAALIARCLAATIEEAIPWHPDPLAERLTRPGGLPFQAGRREVRPARLSRQARGTGRAGHGGAAPRRPEACHHAA